MPFLAKTLCAWGFCVYLLQISVLEVLIYEMLVGMLSLEQQKKRWGRRGQTYKLVDRDILLGNQIQNSTFLAFWACRISLTSQGYV